MYGQTTIKDVPKKICVVTLQYYLRCEFKNIFRKILCYSRKLKKKSEISKKNDTAMVFLLGSIISLIKVTNISLLYNISSSN